MNLFLKSFIIGIAKIIPGLSGAMLAVSFGLYDKLINAITNFFSNKKENFKFLLIFGFGVLLAIVTFSNIVRYLLNNYYFPIMMLFIGLIIGGTIEYTKNIKFNLKNIIIIILVILFIMILTLNNQTNTYQLTNTFLDYIMFFLGGIIEIFSSIVPGISGTALLMLLGIYDNILLIFSNIFNISFIINNIGIYISYSIGLFLSFIIFSILISYIIKKYRNLFDTVVYSLSISSIILLFLMAFNSNFNLISLVIGIILLFIGIFISYIFDK